MSFFDDSYNNQSQGVKRKRGDEPFQESKRPNLNESTGMEGFDVNCFLDTEEVAAIANDEAVEEGILKEMEQPVISDTQPQPSYITPTDTDAVRPCTVVKEEFWGAKVKQRDAAPRELEATNKIKFQTVENDGSGLAMKRLSVLKNIFSKQLPKMPKEYITRLVYDKKHRSLCILKDDQTVVGGTTFRLFPTQNFCEIVFCAVRTENQVRGFGTRLMVHLKEEVKRSGVYNLLTYADNFAIGYFKKQGFTIEVRLETKYWRGYIKDYEGGTLMHCKLDKKIDYLEAPRHVHKQRMKLYEILKQYCNQHFIYEGLECFKNPRVTSIKADRLESLIKVGWNPDEYRKQLDGENQVRIKKKMTQLMDVIWKDETAAWCFREPVDTSAVTDYLKVISDPMDLATIKQRVQQGFYITEEMLFSDLQRVCDNCKKFNPEGSIWFAAAKELENKYLKPKRPKSTHAWHKIKEKEKKEKANK